jgi:hypothetical protein
MTRSRRTLAVSLATALLAASLPWAQAQTTLFDANERVSVATEPTLDAGVSDLLAYCDVRGATLRIDRIETGSIPAGGLSSRLPPGSHFFELSVPGYYDLRIWLALEEKTLYTVTFSPERIMGWLSVQVEPADASVSLDGAPIGSGTVEVPAGSHIVVVRRFGFVERSQTVEIRERSTTRLSLLLERATFEISALGFDRSAFNPANAGAPGKAVLSFRATSHGSAVAEIRGPDGSLAATLNFMDMATWNQSGTWDGLGPDGRALPDGPYSVLLTATPEPGLPSDRTITASATVSIDSSLVIRAYGTASAVPGLLHMPDPRPQPAGTLAAEASWFAPWGSPQTSAFGLSAAISLGGVATLAIHAAAETGSSPGNGGEASASALVALFGERPSALSGAFFIKGGYSSVPSPTMPGAGSALEASLPLSARIGEFSLALSPGALVDFSSGSTSVLGLARAGLWLEGRSFRTGLSAELPMAFSGALPSPRWPAKAALEGRLMLGSTPLVAAAYLGAELEPGGAPRAILGLGLGLLF